MKHGTPWIPLLLTLAVAPTFATRVEPATDRLAISVQPSTLALMISASAGLRVRVPDARVVGVFEPRVFVIETASRLLALPRPARPRRRAHPARRPQSGAQLIVASTVTVFGVARTVLGIQVTGEIPWPSKLDRQLIDHLEIGAALLATSVQTAEGVELTDQARTGDLSFFVASCVNPTTIEPADWAARPCENR